jgi:DNA-binding HxlR family transcriptional regulator
LARAAELIGERWAMLVIRDLLVGPKRFSDLQRGLPKIPSNILTSRLKELEAAGVLQRRALPRPSGGVAYELTEDGRGLEEAVIALGRWGAKHLGDPRLDEIVTEDSMAMALRSIFRPEAAKVDELGFELRMGEIVVNARVSGGTVTIGKGALPAPDLVIEGGPAIRALLAREMTAKEALQSGTVRIRGKRALFDRFVAMFRI